MAEEEKRFHEKLADRLIEAREAAGITQEKLAEKVGLQSNSIHRYEAAERKMNFFTAVKVADALNTTVFGNGLAICPVQSDICATEKNIGMHKNKIMKKER